MVGPQRHSTRVSGVSDSTTLGIQMILTDFHPHKKEENRQKFPFTCTYCFHIRENWILKKGIHWKKSSMFYSYIQKTGLAGRKNPQKIQVFRRKIVSERENPQSSPLLSINDCIS